MPTHIMTAQKKRQKFNVKNRQDLRRKHQQFNFKITEKTVEETPTVKKGEENIEETPTVQFKKT